MQDFSRKYNPTQLPHESIEIEQRLQEILQTVSVNNARQLIDSLEEHLIKTHKIMQDRDIALSFSIQEMYYLLNNHKPQDPKTKKLWKLMRNDAKIFLMNESGTKTYIPQESIVFYGKMLDKIKRYIETNKAIKVPLLPNTSNIDIIIATQSSDNF